MVSNTKVSVDRFNDDTPVLGERRFGEMLDQYVVDFAKFEHPSVIVAHECFDGEQAVRILVTEAISDLALMVEVELVFLTTCQ